MIDFTWMILAQIGPGTPQRRCFIMENLSSHHNVQMAALIWTAGHKLVFRAPYYPIDGPIKLYLTLSRVFFASVGCDHRRDISYQRFQCCFATVPSFEPYFLIVDFGAILNSMCKSITKINMIYRCNSSVFFLRITLHVL